MKKPILISLSVFIIISIIMFAVPIHTRFYCPRCMYYAAKSSITSCFASYYTPKEIEIIKLVKDFAIKNPNLNWSFLADFASNIPHKGQSKVKILNVDSVKIENIGWYKEVDGIEYWPFEARLKGEYNSTQEDDAVPEVKPFKTTLVLLLHKNGDNWEVTHAFPTKNNKSSGLQVSPIFKP